MTTTDTCPHCGEFCYAQAVRDGDGQAVYREREFCPICGGHLLCSGICIDGCLGVEQTWKRAMIARAAKETP